MQNSLLHNDSVCWVDGTFNGSNNLADASSTGCPGVLSTPLTTATVGPLSDNGCTMPLADGSCLMTHALLAGSEALDVAVSGSTTDQRGFGTSDIRDIGAFEAQPPVVTAPPDITVEATGPLTSPALGVATVTDVDETGVLTATALQTSDFPLGVTVLTWTATDSYGFFATDTQVITIADTTAPVITLSGPNPQQQQIGDPYVEFGASAVDLVDDNVTLSAAIVIDATAVNVNVAGTYLVTYNVTDNQGNPAETVSREVQVNDYQPVAVNDTFIINEDTLLTADDVDGKATTDSNDNSVLVNDSDPNGDQLTVVHTGVSTMAGMGGSLNMSADGTFTYTPVPNAFGTDQLNFLITNGSYASLTKLIVVVNPVNDAPSFSLMGHVDVTGLVNFNDDFVEVPGFVENIVLGPNNENDQQVDSFIVNTMDAAEVINAVSIDDSGLLRVDINIGNYGDATVQVRLKDDGGTANGGDDTSSIESFVVIYDDLIFYDGFEVNTEPFDTD